MRDELRLKGELLFSAKTKTTKQSITTRVPTIIDEKVGKATTFHLPSTCAPPPPPPTESMLDKIKLFLCVIDVICPNIDWGGGVGENK